MSISQVERTVSWFGWVVLARLDDEDRSVAGVSRGRSVVGREGGAGGGFRGREHGEEGGGGVDFEARGVGGEGDRSRPDIAATDARQGEDTGGGLHVLIQQILHLLGPMERP